MYAILLQRVHVETPSVMSDFCYPIDYALPGSSVHGTLQARILEWVAFPPHMLPEKPQSSTESTTK